jgi:hypothetical protein
MTNNNYQNPLTTIKTTFQAVLNLFEVVNAFTSIENILIKMFRSQVPDNKMLYFPRDEIINKVNEFFYTMISINKIPEERNIAHFTIVVINDLCCVFAAPVDAFGTIKERIMLHSFKIYR